MYHVLSELATMARLLGGQQDMVHSFIELDEAVVNLTQMTIIITTMGKNSLEEVEYPS